MLLIAFLIQFKYLACKTFEGQAEGDPDYVVAGESHLLDGADDVTQLKGLFDAFEQKKHILELVDRSIHAEGVQIYIGDEAGYDGFGDFSIITTPYGIEGETLGMLGVIGPTRMAYEKVIPVVEVTAKMLSSALDRTKG